MYGQKNEYYKRENHKTLRNKEIHKTRLQTKRTFALQTLENALHLRGPRGLFLCTGATNDCETFTQCGFEAECGRMWARVYVGIQTGLNRLFKRRLWGFYKAF